MINFIWNYIRDHGIIHLKHRLLSKKVIFFSTGGQFYEKKPSIFQFLPGVGVSVQIFMLGSGAIPKFQIFGDSRSNTIENLNL